MSFTSVNEDLIGMDSSQQQHHGEVLLSLLARHKSLEGKKQNCFKFSAFAHLSCLDFRIGGFAKK